MNARLAINITVLIWVNAALVITTLAPNPIHNTVNLNWYLHCFSSFCWHLLTDNLPTYPPLFVSIQVGLGGLGALHQDLRQPGLPDPDGALRAGPEWGRQPLGAQQVLQRGEAGQPEALQPGGLPRPVEDRSLVRGPLPPTCDGCSCRASPRFARDAVN